MSRTMTLREVQQAWADAQAAMRQGSDFYSHLAGSLGLSEKAIKQHFGDWNKLPHEQAVAIAERNGTDVRRGGFQAYLVEVLNGGRRAALERAWGEVSPLSKRAAKWKRLYSLTQKDTFILMSVLSAPHDYMVAWMREVDDMRSHLKAGGINVTPGSLFAGKLPNGVSGVGVFYEAPLLGHMDQETLMGWLNRWGRPV